MKRLLIAVLLGAPLLAHADAYRCKQPDGSLAFQDHPCAGGARGGSFDMPSAQGYSPPARAVPAQSPPLTREDIEREDRKRQAEKDAVQERDNRAMRCTSARNSLVTLNQQVRVYTQDENYKRSYIDDKDRPAVIAATQQEIEDNCQ